MTINRACRHGGSPDDAHEPPVAHQTSGSTTTDHDGSTLSRLDAIEAHLDEMLIQLDQIRAHLAPLLAELAPGKSEDQDRSTPQ
ncbi:hypothetical protein [Haloechinothrix salitolerans]|uniref:Uncharacterized protein n=1 Tax=Haloechinothrix salitolerans TaxID=926830 RepID=A0ABW2C2J3_9PSEU